MITGSAAHIDTAKPINSSISVGINLLWLEPGVVGGSEEYTIRLLRALDSCRPRTMNVRVYGSERLFTTYRDLSDRFEAVVMPTLPRSRAARVATEATWLRSVTSEDTLVHHAGGVVPPQSGGTNLLTIHDLQPLDMPENFSRVKRAWMATMLPRSVRRATHIITPSVFSAERLRSVLSVPAPKITVVSQGRENQRPGIMHPDIDRRLQRRYGRYLLYPAITYPHKRHIDLINALEKLRWRYPDLSLVFTGRPGPLTDELEALAARLGLEDRIHHTGRISEIALDALYRSAAATVIPSEYEGFGNPALEAMVRGCPVVAANTASLPEVLGSAGRFFTVRDPQDLAASIVELLEDRQVGARMRQLGLEQAKRYSWQASGELLAHVYERLACGASSMTMSAANSASR